MQSHGDASGPRKGFVHQALIYGSDREFMDVALPFAEEGLRANEPTLVAVQGRHVENLRAALGGDPEGLTADSREVRPLGDGADRGRHARPPHR
jgi:hypothetical protein